MSWKNYLKKNLVADHKTSKAEIDELRAAVARNLKDAQIQELSSDNRFGIAYQAALLVAKMAIACAGYRVKGQGAHHTTFQVLPLALGPKSQELADYLELCRRKRNELSYDSEGIVSTHDAEDLVRKATNFLAEVESWISQHHLALK